MPRVESDDLSIEEIKSLLEDIKTSRDEHLIRANFKEAVIFSHIYKLIYVAYIEE